MAVALKAGIEISKTESSVSQNFQFPKSQKLEISIQIYRSSNIGWDFSVFLLPEYIATSSSRPVLGLQSL